MKRYIQKLFKFSKLNLMIAAINCIFSHSLWSTASCPIDDNLIQKNQYKNSVHIDINLIEESIKKLFRYNKLPINFNESYDANNECLVALHMLQNRQELEALSHLFIAEHYLIPGSIHILGDIMKNQYPEIPAQISQAIGKQFEAIKEAMKNAQCQAFKKANIEDPFVVSAALSKIDPVESLYKSYDQRFGANERALATNQHKTSKIKVFLYNVIDLISIRDEPAQKNQSVLEVKIPLLKSNGIDASKKIR